jgi:hypothetical protein
MSDRDKPIASLLVDQLFVTDPITAIQSTSSTLLLFFSRKTGAQVLYEQWSFKIGDRYALVHAPHIP